MLLLLLLFLLLLTPASEMAAPWSGCSLEWLLLGMAASGMAASESSYFADFEQFKTFSSHFADFEQIKIFSSHFADFEQIKIFSSHFADFEQVKKTSYKTPVGETGCLCIFFWPWPHVTGTPPWLLKPVRVSSISELYPDT